MVKGNGSKKRTPEAAPEISPNADKTADKNKEKIYKIDESFVEEEMEGDDKKVEGDSDTSSSSSSADEN